MSRKDKNKSTDILVGVAAIFAIVGIAFLLVTYGFDNPSTGLPVPNHKSDTIHSLPLIKFKSDSAVVGSDSIPDPEIK